MKSKTNKTIIDVLRKNMKLFSSFDSVYLFGSTLINDKVPNDIDVLIVYSEYTNKIKDEVKRISSVLEDICKIPVDLTVLSVQELQDTDFLNKIALYLKLKKKMF